MLTDVGASKMFLLLHEGESVAGIARRLEMSEKTVRKYRDANQLPSQIERPERAYRTRQDPLADFWSEIEAYLQQDSQLKPYAILDWLKQKYNAVDRAPRVTDSIRRTLERRIQRWKLANGVEQDVKFAQTHHAGDVIACSTQSSPTRTGSTFTSVIRNPSRRSRRACKIPCIARAVFPAGCAVTACRQRLTISQATKSSRFSTASYSTTTASKATASTFVSRMKTATLNRRMVTSKMRSTKRCDCGEAATSSVLMIT